MSKLSIPFYHGTDRKLLSLSKEQRDAAKTSAFNLIHYFADVYVKNEFEFKDYHISAFEKKKKHNEELKEKLGDYCSHTWHCYGMCTSYIKSKNYQYDSFYVTGIYSRAHDFAKKAAYYGEIGDTAFTLWNGANLLGYQYDKGIIDSDLSVLQKIWDIPADSVILKFNELDKDLLLMEDGREVPKELSEDYFFTLSNYRLKVPFEELTDYEIIHLSQEE